MISDGAGDEEGAGVDEGDAWVGVIGGESERAGAVFAECAAGDGAGALEGVVTGGVYVDEVGPDAAGEIDGGVAEELVKLTWSMVLKTELLEPLRKLAVVEVSQVLLFWPPCQVRTLELPM